ncbi:MAG TPA: MFS transporter, partial [Polyangiaceae bacterium]
YFCAFLLVSNLPTSLPLFVRDEFHWGKLGVAWLFTASGAIGVAIQGFAIERISRLLGEMRSMVLGCLLCTVGLAGTGWFHTPVPFVASLGVFLVGLGIVQPMLASVASRLAPRAHQGTVLGVAQSAGGLARTVGPTASGFLYDARGPSSPFAWSAVVAAVSVLLAAWLRVLDGETVATRAGAETPRPEEGQ